MVCTPSFNAILHLVKANDYARAELLKAGLMETLMKISKARNFTGRVYKMCLDIYHNCVSKAEADELKGLPVSTTAALHFLEEKYQLQKLNEEAAAAVAAAAAPAPPAAE